MRQLKITQSITNRESTALEKYLQDISREDLVSLDEEVELAQKIRQGDVKALERLTKANLRFVVSVAKQYQNQGLSLPDLINEGNLGLIKAAKKYDETRGFKFISYAVWWIRQSIMQARTRANEPNGLDKQSTQGYPSVRTRTPTPTQHRRNNGRSRLTERQNSGSNVYDYKESIDGRPYFKRR